MIPISILRVAVIVMGVLIVAGLVVIGVKILQKSKEAAKYLNAEAVNIPVDEAKVTEAMATTPFHVSIEQLGLESEARLLSIDVEGGNGVERISKFGSVEIRPEHVSQEEGSLVIMLATEL